MAFRGRGRGVGRGIPMMPRQLRGRDRSPGFPERPRESSEGLRITVPNDPNFKKTAGPAVLSSRPSRDDRIFDDHDNRLKDYDDRRLHDRKRSRSPIDEDRNIPKRPVQERLGPQVLEKPVVDAVAVDSESLRITVGNDRFVPVPGERDSVKTGRPVPSPVSNPHQSPSLQARDTDLRAPKSRDSSSRDRDRGSSKDRDDRRGSGDSKYYSHRNQDRDKRDSSRDRDDRYRSSGSSKYDRDRDDRRDRDDKRDHDRDRGSHRDREQDRYRSKDRPHDKDDRSRTYTSDKDRYKDKGSGKDRLKELQKEVAHREGSREHSHSRERSEEPKSKRSGEKDKDYRHKADDPIFPNVSSSPLLKLTPPSKWDEFEPNSSPRLTDMEQDLLKKQNDFRATPPANKPLKSILKRKEDSPLAQKHDSDDRVDVDMRNTGRGMTDSMALPYKQESSKIPGIGDDSSSSLASSSLFGGFGLGMGAGIPGLDVDVEDEDKFLYGDDDSGTTNKTNIEVSGLHDTDSRYIDSKQMYRNKSPEPHYRDTDVRQRDTDFRYADHGQRGKAGEVLPSKDRSPEDRSHQSLYRHDSHDRDAKSAYYDDDYRQTDSRSHYDDQNSRDQDQRILTKRLDPSSDLRYGEQDSRFRDIDVRYKNPDALHEKKSIAYEQSELRYKDAEKIFLDSERRDYADHDIRQPDHDLRRPDIDARFKEKDFDYRQNSGRPDEPAFVDSRSDIPAGEQPLTTPDDGENKLVVKDPTIENILKSIGFNFELSKMMQEKAKKERSEDVSASQFGIINESRSFLSGGLQNVDLGDVFKEQEQQKKKKIAEVIRGDSYEERAKRYREEQARLTGPSATFKDKDERSRPTPTQQASGLSMLQDSYEEPAPHAHEGYQRYSDPYHGSGSMDRESSYPPSHQPPLQAQPKHRMDYPSPDAVMGSYASADYIPSADYQPSALRSIPTVDLDFSARRSDSAPRKDTSISERPYSSASIDSSSRSSNRTVLPPKSEHYKTDDVKEERTIKLSSSQQRSPAGSQDGPKLHKKVKTSQSRPVLTAKEREKLLREQKERQKRLEALERELSKLRKQQNELMRKKQRQKDGHKDPLLIENNKLQEEIANQITALRKAAEENSKALGSVETKNDSSTVKSVKKKESKKEEKVKEKPKIEEVKKIEVKKEKQTDVGYEYFDAGNHWCRLCNSISTNVYNYLGHLVTKPHQQKVDLYNRPWMPESLKNPVPKPKMAKTMAVPIKGLEFLMSVSAFYCTLCKEFAGDMMCAEDHLKTEKHSERYQKYVDDNPFYERRLNLDRAAGVSIQRDLVNKDKDREKRKSEDERIKDEKKRRIDDKNQKPSKKNKDMVYKEKQKTRKVEEPNSSESHNSSSKFHFSLKNKQADVKALPVKDDWDSGSKSRYSSREKKDRDSIDRYSEAADNKYDDRLSRINIKLTGKTQVKQAPPPPPLTGLMHKTFSKSNPKTSSAPLFPVKTFLVNNPPKSGKDHEQDPAPLDMFLKISGSNQGVTSKSLPVFQDARKRGDILDPEKVADYKLLGIEPDSTTMSVLPRPPPQMAARASRAVTSSLSSSSVSNLYNVLYGEQKGNLGGYSGVNQWEGDRMGSSKDHTQEADNIDDGASDGSGISMHMGSDFEVLDECEDEA